MSPLTKSLLYLLLLASFNICRAQKLRLTNASNSWIVEQQGGDFIDIHLYSCNNQTTINGLQYQVVVDTIWHTVYWPVPWMSVSATAGLIREDTVSNKVFVIRPPATQEEVLYDYNMAVGDTVKLRDSVYIVQQLDSFTINNTWHKRWYLESIGHPFPYYCQILEGIGSTYGIFNYPETFEQHWHLTCFSNSSIFQTTGPSFISSTWCKTSLAVEELAADDEAFSVYPNPLTSTSKILLPYKMVTGELTIYSFEGRRIYHTDLTNAEEIILGQMPLPGLYSILVTDKLQGRSYSIKAIQQ